MISKQQQWRIPLNPPRFRSDFLGYFHFVFVLFDLILYVPSKIFQLNRGESSWVEPVLSYDKCVLLKGHNAVTQVRLEPAAPQSRVKHSTTEPLRSHIFPLILIRLAWGLKQIPTKNESIYQTKIWLKSN